MRTQIICLCLSVLALGCSRAFYRHQADGEVYQLVDCASRDPRWPLEDYTIETAPDSRLFDPHDPDCSPMPPDDPTSHKLMHCVDCKRGYCCWHANGDAPGVENPTWESYLPYDDKGCVVVDLDSSVQLALLNSRDYQSQLEELYLSALDVTFERFRFDAQFFGGNSTFFTADGRDRSGTGESSSVLNTDTDFQIRKLFPAGGELVVGMANSLVWQFSGNDTYRANTLLNFNLVQPLLRAGGREVVMERLTLTERALLANIRQMERYRQGFYVEVAAGRDAGQGPSRRGGVFGGSGLEGFSGVGQGGFGQVGGGGGGGAIAGGAGAADAGGFLGLLQTEQEIRNQEANVAGLRETLAQFDDFNRFGGRVERFQVDLAAQALFNAQSRLLTSQAAQQTTLDTFKITLGLPPQMCLRLDDPLLDQFNLIDPALDEIRQSIRQLLEQLRAEDAAGDAQSLAERLQAAASIKEQVTEHLQDVQSDFSRLEQSLDAREESLRRLAEREEVRSGQVDRRAFDVDDFHRRVGSLRQEFATLLARVEAIWAELDQLQAEAAPGPAVETLEQLVRLMEVLAERLGELTLIQAQARLETSTLVPIDLSSEEALEIARQNRLDWMNARAALVDTWRLIEFNADDLESDLDLVFSGDISSTDDSPFRFRDTTGRLRVGLEFDTPLTRLAERNTYRQALIEYQQARRSYMAFEDGVARGLRNILRTIELNQLNFELRRFAVRIAIAQVDQAQLKPLEPPQTAEGQTVFQPGGLGPTAARDLVGALSDLLSAQNDYLSVWVNYEVQRMNLDLDLGTMQLDDCGLWLDPGTIRGSDFNTEDAESDTDVEEVPPGMEIEEHQEAAADEVVADATS